MAGVQGPVVADETGYMRAVGGRGVDHVWGKSSRNAVHPLVVYDRGTQWTRLDFHRPSIRAMAQPAWHQSTHCGTISHTGHVPADGNRMEIYVTQDGQRNASRQPKGAHLSSTPRSHGRRRPPLFH